LAASATERATQLAGNVAAVTKTADGAAARVDEVAGMVTLMDAAFGKLTALVEDYATTASGEDGALTARLDEVARVVDIAASATEALCSEFRVAGVAGRELAARVDEIQLRTDGLVQNVDQVAARLTGRVDEIDARTDQVADLVDKQTGELTSELRAAIKGQGEQAVRIGQVEETVTGFVNHAGALAREISAIDEAFKTGIATIGAVENQSRDALRRVTIALDQMPAGFMIDQAGVLNRVNRAGDVTELGVVVGKAKDGRDGTSPAQIVAVRIDGERLVMTLSDRSEIGCAMPPRQVEAAPPALAVDPVKLGYLSKDVKVRAVQVEHMADMRENGNNYKKIAELFAISERTAARLIKEHHDARSSDS
jgi:hypothetical protein